MDTMKALVFVTGICLVSVHGLDSLTYSMEEESIPGTFIGNIKLDSQLESEFSAQDFNRLTFNFLSAADSNAISNSYFYINNATGILTVQNVLDRDTLADCAFRPTCIISFDVGVGPNDLFRVIAVHIELEDINDNAPVFSSSEVFLNVSEVAPVGTTFQLPIVSDSDGEAFGVETMKLSSATDQFTVRWTRGINGQVQPRLELRQRLDREQVATFDLTVTAQDGGSPALTDILLVHVDVVDANDNTPQFQESGYQARVPEDSPRGTTVVTVEAEDLDHGHNGDVRYSMAEATIELYNTLFQVDEVTGVITIQNQLDREAKDVYFLSVVATDRGSNGRQASATVTVFVDDVNDNSPSIKIRVITDSGLPEISESADIGTFVALLSVTDQDWGRNADVTCSLSTADFHLVAIQPNKYKLVTSVLLDRESQDLYSIEIYCHDHGVPQRSNAQTLVVHVTDVNDNDPIFQHGDFSVHVAENAAAGTRLGQVTALDMDFGDNGRITYAPSESFSRYVHVDEITGEITTTNKLDREATRQFNVHVIARDHADIPRSSMCTITVLVDDVNDNSPRFVQSSYTYVVTENEHSSRELGVLAARDSDDYPYNQIEYSLVGPQSSYFRINSENGTLYAVRPLDRETTPVLTLNAVAMDLDKRFLTGTANITIYVSDVNDNPPRIIYPSDTNNSLTIPSNVPLGSVLAVVEAADDDAGQNADLEFFLKYQRPSDADLLSIDVRSGQLKAERGLNAYDQGTVSVTVVVKDNGIPSLVKDANLTLTLNGTWLPAVDEHGREARVGDDGDGIDITIVIIVVAVTVIVVVVLVVAIACVLCKSRRNKRKPKLSIEKVDLTYDVERQRHIGNSDWDLQQKHTRTVSKIYDPKSDKHTDVDRDSCGSAEGSTTDSGRGASEEGEHGDHGVKQEPRLLHSVYPGADDSIVSSNYDSNTSFDHVTIPRRSNRNVKNVTFEEDVTVTEIPERDQFRYDSPYTSCPAISLTDTNSSWSQSDLEDNSLSMLSVHNNSNPAVPRRTVRNVKAKDRNKRLDSGVAAAVAAAAVQPHGHLQHAVDCPEYVHSGQTPCAFSDSSSLLRYKAGPDGEGSTGNVSELTDATSTTSGSYIVDGEMDEVCD